MYFGTTRVLFKVVASHRAFVNEIILLHVLPRTFLDVYLKVEISVSINYEHFLDHESLDEDMANHCESPTRM